MLTGFPFGIVKPAGSGYSLNSEAPTVTLIGAGSSESYSSCSGIMADLPGVKTIGFASVPRISSCDVVPVSDSCANWTGFDTSGSNQEKLTIPLQSAGIGDAGGEKSIRIALKVFGSVLEGV